jgi:cytochrome bd-type quinol oxidase subunit 2
MELDPVLLSRVQFAFVVSFHIIFPPSRSAQPLGRAAPDKSLSFLFWGAGVFVLPVILIHTAVIYWLLRGKLRKGHG